MMSAEYMHQLQRDAERTSKRDGVYPFVLRESHKSGLSIPTIPFVGLRKFRGWRVADLTKMGIDRTARGYGARGNVFFVDSSGLDDGNSLALTMNQFLKVAPAGFGYAVVEAGQFQVCIRAYIPPVALRLGNVNYKVAE